MNPRVQPDRVYVNGVPIPIAYFQGIDSLASQAVNGASGGTWNPTSAIAINGAGLWIAGDSSLSSGSAILTASGSGARVRLASNDMIGLGSGHTSKTRVVVTGCGGFLDASAGVQTAAYAFGVGGAKMSGTGGRMFVPLRTHRVSTFTQAVLTIITVGGHSSIPSSQPKMRIVAVSYNGDVIPLKTTSDGGWQQFAVAAPVSNYNSQILSLTYTPDAGQIVVDSIFGYVAEIVDEAGTSALSGTEYVSVACTFSSIPDLRPD